MKSRTKWRIVSLCLLLVASLVAYVIRANDPYVLVGGVNGDALNGLSDLLESKGVDAYLEGSRGYDIRVRESQRAKAWRIMDEAAVTHGWRMRLLDSTSNKWRDAGTSDTWRDDAINE